MSTPSGTCPITQVSGTQSADPGNSRFGNGSFGVELTSQLAFIAGDGSDPWGDPIPNDERVGYISPVLEKDQSNDLVRTEAARLGIGAAKAPQSIQLPSAGQRDIGKVALTPEQRDIFGDVAGHFAHQAMDPIVHGPDWALMPDMIKAEVFQKVLEKANQLSKVTALSDQQRQQEIQRIVAAVSNRLKQCLPPWNDLRKPTAVFKRVV